MMEAGELVTLDIVKPAAGGRMLARHAGLVVLVWGAIPGERVRARIQRVGKGVAFGETVDLVQASPDRRAEVIDWRCGGRVLAHASYPRQVALKAEILADAFARIGRLTVSPPPVIESPERGYRMRARLHVRTDRVGFFREESHDLCDAGLTGQLLPATVAWLASVQDVLRRERLEGVAWMEIAENIPADQRACHFEVSDRTRPVRYEVLAALAGREVSDTLHARSGDRAAALRLRRDARAFFQGNRFLLERLAQLVVSLVASGPVVDLYAGVGLFGLSAAAAGAEAVTLVEGDPISSSNLLQNAEPFGARTTVLRQSVEAFLASHRAQVLLSNRDAAVIVDPPRSGLSRAAAVALIRCSPQRIVYVSCDPATLARDVRTLVDAGYRLDDLTGIDLFPNTAHVEAVAVLSRTTSKDPW